MPKGVGGTAQDGCTQMIWGDESVVDFTKNFQIRARSQEEANAIMEALHAVGCKWNGGEELSPEHSNWGVYKEDTVYDVWANRGGKRVLYGSKIDRSVKLYFVDELLQELYGEDNDQDLNIESLL